MHLEKSKKKLFLIEFEKLFLMTLLKKILCLIKIVQKLFQKLIFNKIV